MQVEFLTKFSKDLDKLKEQSIKEKLLKIILDFENANSLSDLGKIKKLEGFTNAYRLRIGDYRLGLFYENGIVELARFIHRKDIYKTFP